MIDVKTMKGAKGTKFLKKLKSIRPIEALKQQGRVIHLNASDGWLDRIFQDPNRQSKDPFVINNREQEDQIRPNQQPSSAVDIAELLRDLEVEEMEFNGCVNGDGDVDVVGDKENKGPSVKPPKCPSLAPIKPTSQNLPSSSEPGIHAHRNNSGPLSELDASSFRPPAEDPVPMAPANSAIENSETPLESETCVSSFRKPDMNSKTLFDPKLLLAFEEAVRDHVRTQEEERRVRAETVKLRTSDGEEDSFESEPLLGFAEKCPPGGSESVILYTTSLRGIRKTFEDCNSIKFLLGSFRIVFYERDVSMHLEFREELWRILGGRVVPPRLFIRGRYIGGADEVVGLHEQGKLLQLFRGIPRNQSSSPCKECGGVRFLLCFNCDGSRKLRVNEGDEGEEMEGSQVQCPDCNENGLIVCPFCC